MAAEGTHENLPPEEPGGSAEKLIFKISDCAVQNVTVYLDRAEVNRAITFEGSIGENEVIIRDISPVVDQESIRVDGNGPATICEVSYQTNHVTPDQEEQNQKQKELEEELHDLKQKQNVLIQKQHRLQKQRDVLDGFADNMTAYGPSADKDKEKNGPGLCGLLGSGVLEGMENFFEFYEKQGVRLDDGLHEIGVQLDQLNQHISTLEANLADLPITHTAGSLSREISILLDVREQGQIELTLTYIVYKAYWSPKYDFRVYNEENSLKVYYYALIRQATGEDWVDAKLSCSTATPTEGGTYSVPELGTMRLTFKPKGAYLVSSYSRERRAKRQLTKASTPVKSKENGTSLSSGELLNGSIHDEFDDDKDDIESIAPNKTPSLITVSSAEVKDGIISTTFDIPRVANIPCDNNAHKVTIAILDLKPMFSYDCIPKKSPNAYLRAKIKNDSDYALLAGPVNIFLDNNFVARTEIKQVSPMEEFNCSLGIDPFIKVDYRPVSTKKNESGILNKISIVKNEQTIEIQNTRQKPITILVTDQIPVSLEEKIKVTVQEPNLKVDKEKPNKPYCLTRANNIEWDLTIPPGETKLLTLKFTVEHPSHEELEIAPERQATVVNEQ